MIAEEFKETEKIYFPLDIIKAKSIIISEIEKLEINCYSEEIERIDIKNFHSRSLSNDLYGQMTGCRFSERAEEIVNHCGGEYSYSIGMYLPVKISYEFKEYSIRKPRAYTALEMYLSKIQMENNIKQLENVLLYIKGLNNKLEIK